MNRLFPLLLVLSLLASFPAEAKPQSPIEATKEIDSAIRAYVTAFNEQKLDTIALAWTPECVHVDRETGEKTLGRDSIRKDLEEVFAAPSKMRLSGQIQTIRLVRPDVAIVDGETTVSAMDIEPITNQFSAVLVKNDGKWQIDSMEEMPLPTPASASDSLSILAWMEGTWVDGAPGSQVFSSVRWSSNKAFLIRSMTEEVDGTVNNLGTQIIGWDPRSRQIRSWVFNADGSFGEGVWTKANETWMIKSSQTLADGSLSSGTYLLDRRSNDELTIQLVGHEVNGEMLPNSEPAVMKRVVAPNPITVPALEPAP
ncbi:SnoaL-like domain protein [Pirellula sp. SH-Sr6A]|uniref:YybH family protein n=1 Tax=Pirellula sp. SH-Sr6A TaxID=1632865 RepID=UPI00078C4D7C|nr:SgcJ/EcaC family oxidoreductase [Pirellula sp. SH-Sr6A]AMV32166.1 SnoaL-like domain protein [Pirellula sp. SH-Sr6A]